MAEKEKVVETPKVQVSVVVNEKPVMRFGDNPDENVTKPYRLKEGKRHFGVEPGGVTELNARQAKAFRDKFDPA